MSGWTYSILLAVASLSVIASSQEFLVQISIYVDYLGVEQWEKMGGKTSQEEMKASLKSAVLNSQDYFYSLENMTPPLKIKLDVTDVRVLTKEEMTFEVKENTTQFSYVPTSMYRFSLWAHANKTKKNHLALLFTGYELKETVQAVGQTEGICSVYSVLFFAIKNYQSRFAIAHEIAHVLGARHDGEPKYSADCPSWEKTVMRPFRAYYTEVVPFSKCSHRSIHEFLVTKGRGDCLVGHNKDKVEKEIVIPALAQTADEVCVDLKGEGWSMYRLIYKGEYGDTFCNNLICMNEGLNTMFESGKAPNGLKCGKNKRCYEGKCLESPNGDPDVVDFCPWGSRYASLDQRIKSCNDACYWSFKYICCGHCGKEILQERA